MAKSAGYVLHTDEEWLAFHTARHRAASVYFTRGPNAALKSIDENGILVFLVRAQRPHRIGGIGRFGGNYSTTLTEAWSTYGPRLGAGTKDHYAELTHRHAIGTNEGAISLLRVDGFLPAEPPLPIAEVGIDAPFRATRGWGIDAAAVDRALSRLGNPVVVPTISDAEIDDQFLRVSIEGRRAVKYHLQIERCRRLVDRAKAEWLRVDSDLRCEVCEFSFRERYADRGAGFIEAHHRTPLHKLVADAVVHTCPEDLAPVCANCHRMLHRFGDIQIGELREHLRGIE